jgi:hypothetical protein
MTDPAAFASALGSFPNLQALFQLIAAFLLLVAAYLGLLCLTIVGIGVVSLLYKTAGWLSTEIMSARASARHSAAHRHLKSKATHA